MCSFSSAHTVLEQLFVLFFARECCSFVLAGSPLLLSKTVA
jgi:hypothetical protein